MNLGAGSEQRSGSARWGGALGEDAHLRLYAKASDTDGFEAVDGSGGLNNDFDRQQVGFRADWTPSGVDQVSLQGDLTRLDQGQVRALPDPLAPPAYTVRTDDRIDVSAGNLLTRWERSLAADSEIRVQAYLDYYRREEITRNERVTTFDLDLQHRFGVAGGHDIVWGLGYRHTDDKLENSPVISGLDESRSLNTFSGFVQDEMELVDDRLWLTVGTKLEHNDLTGVEWQPNLRALWTPDANQSLWASAARAVRTPSFGERDYRIQANVFPPFSDKNPGPLPVLRVFDGNHDFGSERLIAYELGYRRRLERGLTLDAALFYNDYDELLAVRQGQPEFQGNYLVFPNPTSNDMEGASYGAELTLDWRPSEHWRIQPTLSLLHSDFRIKAGNNLTDEGKLAATRFREGTDPEFQFSLRTGWSPRSDLDLDLWLRYVSEVPEFGAASGLELGGVGDYLTLDLRAAWRPYPELELALTGKNLLESRHLEGIEELYPVPGYVPRSLFATLKYEF